MSKDNFRRVFAKRGVSKSMNKVFYTYLTLSMTEVSDPEVMASHIRRMKNDLFVQKIKRGS